MEDKFRKYQRWNLILVLLVIVGFGVFYAMRGSTAPSYELDGERFVLLGPEEFATEVRLDQIADMQLLDSFQPETCISGGTTGGCAYGTWENAELGRYQLCALTRVNNGIMISERNGNITVCNFESAQTTNDFYRSLRAYMEENGFL